MSVGSHFFTHSVRSLTSSSDALKSAISSTRRSHTNSPLNSISSVFHFYFFYIMLMQLLSALSLSNLLAQHFNPFLRATAINAIRISCKASSKSSAGKMRTHVRIHHQTAPGDRFTISRRKRFRFPQHTHHEAIRRDCRYTIWQEYPCR